jgi:putative ABC transport system permease protein
VLGRPYTESEDVVSGPKVVVLSEQFWRDKLNAEPDVIGKEVRLSGQSYEVIGVCPQQVSDALATRPNLFLPVNIAAQFDYELQRRDQRYGVCVARLDPRAGLHQAQADLSLIQKNLNAAHPEYNGIQISLLPLATATVADYSGTLWLVCAAAACLLLISGANVTGLLFSRALQRRSEMTLRAALGASRARLFAQLIVETTLLSTLGGGLGILIAAWLIDLIKAVVPQGLYRLHDVSLNLAALVYVLVATLFLAFFSGLIPAWIVSKVRLASTLREEGSRSGTSGPKRQRMQSTLIVGKLALACVLITGTTLFMRSFQAAQTVPLGFNPSSLRSFFIYPTGTQYQGQALRIREFFDRVVAKAHELPGVTSAGLIDDLPFGTTVTGVVSPFYIPGQPEPAPGREPVLRAQLVSPGYFRTMEIPLVRGRDFDPHDTIESRKVVIVNQALADRYFPGQNPIGKTLDDLTPVDGSRGYTIVGVVRNSLHGAPFHQSTPFQAYFSYDQRTLYFESLVLRASGDPAALQSQVRAAVASIDPDVVVVDEGSYDSIIAGQYATQRLCVALLGFFSGAALLLAAVGLYAILAYSVGQRTRDIGVRIALGATSANILRLVIGQGAILTGTGLAIGFCVALLLAPATKSILFSVSVYDPLSLGFSILFLVLIAVFASLIPALRAIRIDPVRALRD